MSNSLPAVQPSTTLLIGVGRPLNYVPRMCAPDYIGEPFPNVLEGVEEGGFRFTVTTIREFNMLHFMDMVTDKQDWHIKLQNPEIVKKWKKELLDSGLNMTPNTVQWCFDELRYKASLFPEAPLPPPPIVVFNGNVVKSDTAVSLQLKQAIQDAVRKFESGIPDGLKDWHPGSDERVWDLVHPSLFPLVYGRSRVLVNGETTTLDDFIERCGQGEIADEPTFDDSQYRYSRVVPMDNAYSKNFQWLPCEVDISTENSRIMTYINNLHPQKEKILYDLISKLIDASIPLWDLTLAPMADNFYFHPRIHTVEPEYEEDSDTDSEAPQKAEDEDEDDFMARRSEWVEEHGRLILPDVQLPFKPLRQPKKLSLRERYGKHGLQIIVKLANIELTPEKPEYRGGVWHVEGQMNERIVATSIYYHSCENITTSTLSFSQQCHSALSLDDEELLIWFYDVYGCDGSGSATQEVGSVETREGRLLTFPNILQHCVSSFKLADPTKPGHRKIIALFLVDPNVKIISTAHVPCQRRDWWWEAVHSEKPQSILDHLPTELNELILDDVEFPISMQEAKEVRAHLMEERKVYVASQTDAFTRTEFSLCEH